MNDDAMQRYVLGAAELLGMPLGADRAQRVAGHLVRTAALAQLIEDVPLGVEDEPAEVYCPAPFPGKTI